MTEKRFEIIKSAIIDGARLIKDNKNKYTFATTFETATLINYRKALNELNYENEQLKKELKTYRSLIDCHNCDYHNYDWFDDGDEFEICEKGNDVTKGICKDWREL